MPFRNVYRDTLSGFVVFLVALPLCLGVASASGASPLAGLVAGVIGGIVVGLLSGSHTSVAGPAAGLTAVVAAQITRLGAYETFLVAVVLAGVFQIVMGVLRAGAISSFFPTSVVKGLLAAIGIILILKELPHLVGHDPDPEGDFSFFQPDKQNTFTELFDTLFDIHAGSALVGLTSLVFLIGWDKIKFLKNSLVPSPSVVVALGILATLLLRRFNDPTWSINGDHLVIVPVFETTSAFLNGISRPDFSKVLDPAVLMAAVTIAIVASLETLLNVEAVDKLDPKKRVTPTNRELVAQGCGNMFSGFLGGLPVTSVIVRSSVNINAGNRTKLSAILHGIFLASCVAFLPDLLNLIPRSCLAAILIVTGIKLASWKIIKSMYKQGWLMFLPFIVTVTAIVFTDLLIGVLIGLGVSVLFILRSSVRRPIRRVVEKHVSGEVLHIHLANQVSFLNRAALVLLLEQIPSGGHVLLDARDTYYIDPDILDLLRTYQKEEAPARGVTVSMLGFHEYYDLEDRIAYADYTSREVRDSLTPDGVLQILKDGHQRFIKGEPLTTRNVLRQVNMTADGQTPLAAVLSCIDSRTPTEMIFDVGLGDIFTARIAGNVISPKIIGSLEFACKVAGAKLILVMGHTRCGAVNAAIDFSARGVTAASQTQCEYLDAITDSIREVIDPKSLTGRETWDADQKEAFADGVVKNNVAASIAALREKSQALRELEADGRIRIVGGVYDVRTGEIHFEI